MGAAMNTGHFRGCSPVRIRSRTIPRALLSGLGAFLAPFLVAYSSPAAADLTLSVEVASDPVLAGEAGSVVITVTNTGAAVADSVKIEADFPTNVSPLTEFLISDSGDCRGSGTGNSVCSSGEIIVWELGPLAVGKGWTVTLPPRIDPAAVAGTTVTWIARAFELESQVASDSTGVDVIASRSLTLSLDDDREPASPLDFITYTLHYSNMSQATFVDASGNGTLGVDTVTWSIGTLLAGQGDAQRVTVQVDSGTAVGSQLSVDAQIVDNAAASARASAITRVAVAEALELAIEVGPSPARVSETLLTSLTVSNTSQQALTGVALALRFPQNLADMGENLVTGGADCRDSGTGNSVCDSGELLVWDIGTLAAGVGATYNLPPAVSGSAAEGTIIRFEASATESTGIQRRAQRSTLVRDGRTLELAIDDDQEPVNPGDRLTYALTYANQSVDSVVDLVLSLPVPPGMIFASASHGGSQTLGLVSWNIGTLQAGQSGQRSVAFDVSDQLADGTLLLADGARLEQTGFFPESARALAVTRAKVPGALDLDVVLTPDPAMPSETLHTAITAIHRGDQPIFDVVLQLRLPDDIGGFGQTYITGGGDCTVSGTTNTVCDARERVVWDVGVMFPGEAVTYTLPPNVASNAVDGSLMNVWVEAFHQGGGQQLATRTAPVRVDRAIDLVLDEARNPVASGEVLAYTISYGNVTEASLSDVTLAVPLPVGASFASATGGGVESGGMVVWDLGDLLPGQSGSQVLRVDVAAGTGDLLRLEGAEIAEDDSSAEVTRVSLATRVQDESTLALAIEVEAIPSRPNETTTTVLTVANRADLDIEDVVLQLRIPQDVNSLSQSFLTGGGVCTVSGTGNTICDARERVFWDLGTIPAGGGSAVTVPNRLVSGALEGSLTTLRAMVSQGDGDQQLVQQTLVTRAARELELRVLDTRDATDPSGKVDYWIDYVNQSNEILQDLELSFRLPPGAIFDGASRGYSFDGDLVSWTFDELLAAERGKASVSVLIDEGGGEGDILRVGEVRLEERGAFPVITRAITATRVEVDPALQLVILPDTREGGEANLDVILETTNHSDGQLFGVTVEAHVPDDVDSFNQSETVGGGICTVSGNTTCNTRERVQWTLGTLDPGQTVQVSMSPTLSDPDNMELTRVVAVAYDDTTHRAIASIGVPEPGAALQALVAVAVLAVLRRRRQD